MCIFRNKVLSLIKVVHVVCLCFSCSANVQGVVILFTAAFMSLSNSSCYLLDVIFIPFTLNCRDISSEKSSWCTSSNWSGTQITNNSGSQISFVHPVSEV